MLKNCVEVTLILKKLAWVILGNIEKFYGPDYRLRVCFARPTDHIAFFILGQGRTDFFVMCDEEKQREIFSMLIPFGQSLFQMFGLCKCAQSILSLSFCSVIVQMRQERRSEIP